MTKQLTCAKAPCKSCPYRKDVPSGVWHATEYDKLPGYDGGPLDQLNHDGSAIFMCHQADGKLCAGWLGTHKPENLIALRLCRQPLAQEVWDYVSPVPLFDSGRAASDHGKKKIKWPDKRAKAIVARIVRKRNPGG
jgi:hypothetical protein